MSSVFNLDGLVPPVPVGGEEIIHQEFGRRMFAQDFQPPYGGEPVRFVLFGASVKPVLIFPVTPEGQIVLVAEFRPAIGPNGSFVVSLPGGCPKEGQSVQDAAVAELEEETGYQPDCVIRLTDSLLTNLSFRMEATPVLATGCVKVCEPHPDATEVIRVLTCSQEDWLSAIMSGEVNDGQSISTTLLALPRLGWLPKTLLPWPWPR
jgi:8-oxo-dGTP pyrophosphatase MutT (NUDIX family)